MAISTATVKAYCNTGFDTVNIPDSPATLQSAAGSVVTLDTLNCLPLAGMTTSITVKSFSGLPSADYVSIAFANDNTTYYGAITNYEYVSLDTVRLDIMLDGWLTCKAKGIDSVSGITKRVHVPKSSDVIGAYTEDDPLLVCSEPLELETQAWCEPADSSQTAEPSQTIIASTIDLFLLGDENYKDAIVYEEQTGTSGTPDNAVTVPKVPGIKTETNVPTSSGSYIHYDTTDKDQTASMAALSSAPQLFARRNIKVPAVNYFDGNDEQVISGIAKARGLGVENGIIAQYTVPNQFLSLGTGTYDGRFSVGSGLNSQFQITGATNVNGVYGTSHEFWIDYRESSDNIQNLRLLVGDMNKFGLVSVASGNSFEARPEDLKDSPSDFDAPSVIMMADPRENGKPYYRFEHINGDDSNFARGIVAGANWQNAPITQFGNAGYEKDIIKMRNQYNLEREQRTADVWSGIINASANILSGGASGSSGFTSHSGTSSSNTSNTSASMSRGINAGVSRAPGIGGHALATGAYGMYNYSAGMSGNLGTSHSVGSSLAATNASANSMAGSYNLGVNMIGTAGQYMSTLANGFISMHMAQKQRLNELEAFALDAFTVAPAIVFPRIPGLVDFIGNGVLIYRYHPTRKDLARLDKVLNAFGYAHTKMLELSDFSNRSRYNYVMASGVKINCNIAKFVREAAQDQIAMGVRVWHRKPDNDYATANN